MGRAIPMVEITNIRPISSITLTVVWVAALVAIVSGLCGLWPSKKGSKSPSTSDKNSKKEGDTETTDATQQPQAGATETGTTEDDQFSTKPLPPPPSAIALELGDNPTGGVKPKIDKTSSLQNYLSKTASRRKLTSSISMRMSTKIIKDKASEFKGKASEFKDKASDLTDLRKKHENESLWTKRIILGEKCRLPNQDDDALTFDKVSQMQMRKAPSMSRSCSSIDHRAVSSVLAQEVKVEEKGKGKEKVRDEDDDENS